MTLLGLDRGQGSGPLERRGSGREAAPVVGGVTEVNWFAPPSPA